MKRLRDLQTGVEFNQGALFKVIRKGITADTTAEEIREMVEDNADDSIRELSPIKQRIKTILDCQIRKRTTKGIGSRALVP